MRVHLLSVGRRMPDWINAGYLDYARRLPPHCALELVEIDPVPRGNNRGAERCLTIEGERLLSAVPKRARIVALDVAGTAWSSAELARHLRDWLASGQDTALLVGGADGLAPACLERAEQRWSLSRLTLPHALVRVILAEQIYRAWSLLGNHPYHRA